MIEEVKKLANHYFEDIVKIRRSIHQNPELSFEEFNTSLFIQNILQENKHLVLLLNDYKSYTYFQIYFFVFEMVFHLVLILLRMYFFCYYI